MPMMRSSHEKERQPTPQQPATDIIPEKVKGQPQLLRGMKDILPVDQPYWKAVVETVEHTARGAAFDRIDTPVLEASSLFTRTPERLQRRLQTMVARSWHPAGTVRQMLAIIADGDRTALLPRISAPTHVMHGAADVLVPVAAAHDLTAKISGSTTDIIPGMGHDLPLPLLERLAQGMHDNAQRAS